MKFDTRVVRAGISPDPETGAILPPVHHSATFVYPEVGKQPHFNYTRTANPTRETLERHLAGIEGGEQGIAFASGMAAVDAVLKLLSSGDHVVSSDDVYGGVSRLFDTVLARQGISFTYVDSSESETVQKAMRPETRLLWVETPTNPMLRVTDLEAMARLAHDHDALLGVDSTFATPALLRPLEWGADIVVHSTTKYISGHNQLVGGVVITNDSSLAERLRHVQKSIGAVPGPADCWLTLLGVQTLSLRMARHSASAMAAAEFLEGHPRVSRVIYPGLPSHPQHEVARRQMSDFSGMISFELEGGLDAVKAMLVRLKLCYLAESLGGVETMITHPATMTHVDVPREIRLARGLTDGLLRLSVGIEDQQDIIDDLAGGLTAPA